MLPLPEQDHSQIQTNFKQWLTVRMVEAWISLKDVTTFLSGEQEQDLLDMLEENPEISPYFKNILKVKAAAERFKATDQNQSQEHGKFIHLCFNHVYAKSLSDLVEHVNGNSEQEHWLFVEKHRAIPQYDADISKNRHSAFFNYRENLQAIIQICLDKSVDAVFVHGLFFPWQKRVVEQVARQKHIAWRIWGGDLYNPIKQGRPLTDLMSHVNSVHSRTKGDFDIFENTYGKRQKCSFGYPIPGLYGEWPEKIEKETPPVIIVGNSGDPSNNHKKILTILAAKKDVKDYRLHLPVAYNLSKNYKNELIQHIKELGLDEITNLQESFIPPKRYMHMVMKSSMLIVVHNRQQALGNIFASIYSGNNTFIKKNIFMEGNEIKNPTWRFVEEHGLKAQPFEDVIQTNYLSDLSPVSDALKKKHQEIIKKRIGLEVMSKINIEACNKIMRENEISQQGPGR